jgi:hypothetical protein
VNGYSVRFNWSPWQDIWYFGYVWLFVSAQINGARISYLFMLVPNIRDQGDDTMAIKAVSMLAQMRASTQSAQRTAMAVQPGANAATGAAQPQGAPVTGQTPAAKVSLGNQTKQSGQEQSTTKQSVSAQYGRVQTVRGYGPGMGTSAGTSAPGNQIDTGATIQFSERTGVCFVTKG